MKALVSVLAAGALLFSQSAAQASTSCYGCNLVDEGWLGSSLVGRSVYLDHTRFVVDQVDLASGKIYVHGEDGRQGWGQANQFYSAQARGERDAAWGVAALGVLCLFVCDNSSHSGSSSRASSGGQSGSSDRTDHYGRRQSYTPPAYDPPKPDTSAGCAWGDRSYGTCH